MGLKEGSMLRICRHTKYCVLINIQKNITGRIWSERNVIKFFRRDRTGRALSVRMTVLSLKAGQVRLLSGTFKILIQVSGISALIRLFFGLMVILCVWRLLLIFQSARRLRLHCADPEIFLTRYSTALMIPSTLSI